MASHPKSPSQSYSWLRRYEFGAAFCRSGRIPSPNSKRQPKMPCFETGENRYIMSDEMLRPLCSISVMFVLTACTFAGWIMLKTRTPSRSCCQSGSCCAGGSCRMKMHRGRGPCPNHSMNEKTREARFASCTCSLSHHSLPTMTKGNDGVKIGLTGYGFSGPTIFTAQLANSPAVHPSKGFSSPPFKPPRHFLANP